MRNVQHRFLIVSYHIKYHRIMQIKMQVGKGSYKNTMSEKLYQDFQNKRQVPLTILGGKMPFQTQLVQDAATGEILVQKIIHKESIPVYRKLMELQSPHLTKIISCEEQQDKGVVTEEYVSGKTLDETLRQKGPMPEELVKNYIGQLLEVLEQVHRQGIVHRDISPKNVLISTDGIVKLLDFDIARKRKVNQNADTTILGTVGFASPEQYGFLQTDVTADIYAVGVLMNVMLEGTLPNMHLTRKKAFYDVVRKCTEIDPQNRYQNVAQLRLALKLGKQSDTKNKTIIPGFQTGVIWKEILAIFIYLILLIGTIESLLQYGKTPQTFLLEALAVFIYAWVACAAGFNFLLWDIKVPGIRSLQKPVRIILRIILALTIFYFGMQLENYIKITMLGLPAK